MITNFGFSSGFPEYWILLSDWRNGSFAILMALSFLFVGYFLATGKRMLAAKIPSQLSSVQRRVGTSVAQGQQNAW
jgi:ATP-dependent helicase YprA (DUF1998 family)